MHSKYDMAQRQTVTNGSLIKFDGVQIGRVSDGTRRTSQQAYIQKLSNIMVDLYNAIAFVCTGRGKVSYIATCTL
jgi:hypothetical protein